MKKAFTTRTLIQHFEDQGDFEKAEYLLSDIVVTKEKDLGAENISLAEDLYELGLINVALDRYSKADHYLKRALAIQVRKYGDKHPDTRETENALKDLERVQSTYVQKAAG